MSKGKVCRIPGCTNILKEKSGQVCQAHRSRLHRHGDYNISPNWTNLKKGKPCITKQGYIRILVDGKRIFEHRHIVEQHIGRKLVEHECVHHINGNKLDNRIENLELMCNNSEHMISHHRNSLKNRNEIPQETIHEIVRRVYSIGVHKSCFCGNPIRSRKLCKRHYHWAWDHKIF